jgi:hypothetical protein
MRVQKLDKLYLKFMILFLLLTDSTEIIIYLINNSFIKHLSFSLFLNSYYKYKKQNYKTFQTMSV